MILLLLQVSVQKRATSMIGSCETMAYAIAKSKALEYKMNRNETYIQAITTDNLGNYFQFYMYNKLRIFNIETLCPNKSGLNFEVFYYLKWYYG